MPRVVGSAWLLALLLLTLAQGASLLRFGRDSHRRVEAGLAVRRIAENSYRYFEGHRPPAGPGFWKAIGRSEPLLDPWGHPYLVEHTADGGFLCRSAGQDALPQSGDDIFYVIPYGFNLDLLQPEQAPLRIDPSRMMYHAK